MTFLPARNSQKLFLGATVVLAFVLAASPILGRNPAEPAARRNAAHNPADYQALPLTRSEQNHLLVRAFINGKPALLGVDTGAPVSAIAGNRRAYFGLGSLPQAANLPARLMINGALNNVVVAQTMRLGGLTLVDEPMVAVDLGAASRAAKMRGEQEIDGILGADILFPTKAVIDCERQLLVMKTNPDTPGTIPGFDHTGYQSIPIFVSEGYNLYVDAKINGRSARMMLDTGAFATLLHRGFARGMNLPLRDTPLRSAAVNLKMRGVQIARINRMSFGSVNIVGKNVGVVDLEGLIHGGLLDAQPPVAGLLGAEILRRHGGIIDFGTRRLYLKG